MDFEKLNEWLAMSEEQRYEFCISKDSCKGCYYFCECQAEMTSLVIARKSNR